MHGFPHRSGIAALALFAAATSHAGVMMQAFYWDVPSPAVGNTTKKWWWDRLTAQANDWRRAGFTAVWLPPMTKGAGGSYSVGYDPYDDYDLGSKDQRFVRNTRYGSREQLQRLCATLRANNLDAMADVVLNHRNGDDGQFNFRHPDAYGTWGGGRFGKTREDFHPYQPQDDGVPEGTGENYALFGRDLAYRNPETARKMREAGDWLTKALDLKGYRLDYMKGVSAPFLKSYLDHGAMAGKFAVGEYWDGNRETLKWWIDTQVQRRAAAFDFPLRYALKEMCLNPGGFDMRTLRGAGLVGIDPTMAVTWLENHDTDTHDPIWRNKLMGYAYILTAEGYPCVFYRDYAVEAGSYGLKPKIDNLVWIHEKLAAGGTVERWSNERIHVFERQGGSKLLVGLNNVQGFSSTITCQTGFGPNVRLQDYTGHAPDVWTDGNGRVTLTIPKGEGGLGYVAYSVAGQGGSTFDNVPRPTVQEFAGATDLDIKPADPWTWVQVCRITTSRAPVRAEFFWDGSGFTSATGLTVSAHDSRGRTLGKRSYVAATPQGSAFEFVPRSAGPITFRIRTANTPSTNVRPRYWLKIRYTAPQRP